jgi:hypothetical protein
MYIIKVIYCPRSNDIGHVNVEALSKVNGEVKTSKCVLYSKPTEWENAERNS